MVAIGTGSQHKQMKEEARQSRYTDPPAIFHEPWQAENSDFLLCRTQTDICHCSSPFCPGQELRRFFQHSARVLSHRSPSCSTEDQKGHSSSVSLATGKIPLPWGRCPFLRALRDRSQGARCKAQVSDPVHLEHAVDERALKAPVHNMTSYVLYYYLSHYTFTVCPLFIYLFISQGNGGELRWRPSRGAPRKSRTLTLTCCKEANNLTESGFLKVFSYFFWEDKATRQRRIFEP